MDKKKVLMGTVVASTMLISGMTLPKATAVELNARAKFQTDLLDGKYTMTTALSSGQKSLTAKDVKTLVEDKYGEDVFKEVKFKDETLSDNAVVPTGSVIELNNGREITVVLYGDVNQDGKVNELDAARIKRVSAKLIPNVGDEAAQAAANLAKTGNGVDEMDAARILRFSAGLLDEEESVVQETVEAEEAPANSILYARSADSTSEQVKKLMGNDYDKYKSNMDQVKDISVEGNTITITADVENMQAYTDSANQNRNEKWIGILVETGVSREKLESSDNYNIEIGKEKEGSESFGAKNNEILLWFDATSTNDTKERKYEDVELKVKDGEEEKVISFNVVIKAEEKTTTTTEGVTQREVSTAAALESSLNSEKITNIVLDNNITIAEKALTIDAEQEKVIDVNGHTITVAEGIVNNGNLTIKDSKQVSTPIMRVMNAVKKITTSDELEKSGIIVESTKDHAIKNEKGAELTIEGGYYDAKENGKAALYNEGKVTVKGGTFTRSLENSNSNTWYTVVNHGEMVIEGGKFENVGNYSSMLINGYASDKDYTEETENPTLEIKGGTFTGGLNTIKNDEIGILTIKSEESKAAPVFENNNQAVLMNWNVTTIEGGTFNYGGKDSIIINGKRDKKPNYEKGELTITGGTFTATQDAAKFAKKQATASAGDVTISDGVLFKGQKATYTEE